MIPFMFVWSTDGIDLAPKLPNQAGFCDWLMFGLILPLKLFTAIVVNIVLADKSREKKEKL